jgi:hypothetical protein
LTTIRQVSLPEGLCASAERQFGAHFQSLESLLEFVLGELVRGEVTGMDGAEKALLEQRLHDLGYL